MSSLINMQDACLSFSNLEILKNSMFYIKKNERICLIGKNGAGKSTLLKIINKTQDLDHGSISYKRNIKISYLHQENPKNYNISIYDFISLGFFEKNINTKKNLLNVQQIIEVEKIIDMFQLEKNILLSDLSGGSLRKVALGRVLVGNPDVLLLDEPTNHLDIKTVKWLEFFLKKFTGSILYISHDRNFIQNTCTRIVNLDRGNLISYPGDYAEFIKLKNKDNQIEKKNKKIFDRKLAIEENWIKKGVKARATRNEGRVKNLIMLRKKYDNYRKIEELNNIKINESSKNTGKIIFKIENIDIMVKNKFIVKNFSSIIQNGDKLGMIGNNGCGKSTMIKTLIGEKQPVKGKIYRSSGLKISYFDQNRSLLNPDKSIIENMNYGNEQNLINYLKNFLFFPKQLKSLVKTLSGGECNRLLLALLFLKPSNLLILDEPTNDLDFETLELLEKIIINYQGTVIIVSHDEKFITNTTNKFWFFEKNGYVNTYIGNYDILKKEKNNLIIKNVMPKKIKKEKNLKINLQKIVKNKSKKELCQILSYIENIEYCIKKLQEEINEPLFFKKPTEEKISILKRLHEKEKELKEKILYWEKLEKIL